MSHSSRDSLWDWDEITVEDLMGEEESTPSSSYVALGSDFSAMDASAQAEIGHAMARTAKLLLAVAADAGQAVLSPPPPLVDNDESYEPYTGHGCSPAEDEEAANAAASAAADAAVAAHEAQQAAHQAATRVQELRSIAADAALEAEQAAERVRASRAREELLDSQVGELEAEARALEEEEGALREVLSCRRAAQEEEGRALRDAEAQVASERRDAQGFLSSAIADLTKAREAVAALEAEISEGAQPKGGETIEQTSQRHDADLAHLAAARELAAQSARALAAVQAEEAAREGARHERLRAAQLAHGRNVELAAIDAEAAQASMVALRYRLEGKRAQSAVLASSLAHCRTLLRVEAPASELARHRADSVGASLRAAEGCAELYRQQAIERMQRAHDLSAASLHSMSIQTGGGVGGGGGDGGGDAGSDLLAAPSALAVISSPSAFCSKLIATERKGVVSASEDDGLRRRLESIAAEAEHWRRAAEELSLMQEAMTDVVFVEMDSSSVSRTTAVGNSNLGAQLGQMLPNSSYFPAAALSSVGSGVASVGSGVASGVATVGSGVASGVAMVGSGVASGVASVGSGVASGLASGLSSAGAGVSSGLSRTGSLIGQAGVGVGEAVGLYGRSADGEGDCTSGSVKATARAAALVGAGVGLAAAGPLGGAALAGAMGAAALAASRRRALAASADAAGLGHALAARALAAAAAAKFDDDDKDDEGACRAAEAAAKAAEMASVMEAAAQALVEAEAEVKAKAEADATEARKLRAERVLRGRQCPGSCDALRLSLRPDGRNQVQLRIEWLLE